MESTEKRLISAVADAWNAAAPPQLGVAAALQLMALREVSGDQMSSALAVAMTWSAAFAATCEGALGGVLVFLLKQEEVGQIERLAKGDPDGGLNPNTRSLVASVLDEAAGEMGRTAGEAPVFGRLVYIDLAADESRLATMVGDAAWVGTFALNVGDDLSTQALILYAPHGTLDTRPAAQPVAQEAAQAPAASSQLGQPNAMPPAAAGSSRRQRREEPPRNIERLLNVELDVVVRFGVTAAPLRDVVRMGVGTMIELNRAIEEPVELLVNGRPLARGEVVVVDGYYGVRITEIGPPAERAASIL